MFRQRVIEKLAEQSDIPDKSNVLPVMATFDEIKKMRGKILAGGAGAGILGGAALTVAMLKAKEKEEIKKALGKG